MSDQNRLVLAYSGGLDTSVAISYLKERTGKDVVAVSLDVGQGGESLETIKQREAQAWRESMKSRLEATKHGT